MIIGNGVDIVEVSRFLDKDRDRNFLERVFNQNEIEYILNKADTTTSLASHFAAKEAFLKAVGTGMGYGFSTKDCEISHDEKGKPYFKLSDRVIKYLNSNKIVTHLSISHEKHYAIASVIIERLT